MTPEEYSKGRGLAASSIKRLRTSVNRWVRILGVSLDESQPHHMAQFRLQATTSGLSPSSVEQTTFDVSTLAGIPRGEPMPIPPPDPDVPTLDRVEAIYRQADKALWPVVSRPQGGIGCSWLKCSTGDYWRAWIVVAGFCGLRRGDMWRVTYEDYQRQRYYATKAKKWIPIVHTPFLSRHVKSLGVTTGKLFGESKSNHQLSRELKRFATLANVAPVMPHGFRRFAIQQWTLAHPEAGRIVHGMGLPRNVMRHYIDPLPMMQKWSQDWDVPHSWMTHKERSDAIRAEDELLRCYRRASSEMRESLLRIARAV